MILEVDLRHMCTYMHFQDMLTPGEWGYQLSQDLSPYLLRIISESHLMLGFVLVPLSHLCCDCHHHSEYLFSQH